MTFKLNTHFKPSGDQPAAIQSLTQGIHDNKAHQVLMGATGSGKTFTIANVIAAVNRPALVIAHNKTLAAQLCNEFRDCFPENAVEYFVSYYDYYQPEAYIPSRDVFIDKEADINEDIEKLRHAATRALVSRRDVIIVASVSCIYGLGAPEEYQKGIITLSKNEPCPRNRLLLKLVKSQYQRNDTELKHGRYRIKGEVIDILPPGSDHLLRLEFWGDTLESILSLDPITGEIITQHDSIDLYPATHYMVNSNLETATHQIRHELGERLKDFEKESRIIEGHRLKQRTEFDLEMMTEMGYCKGIENYSRHISGRQAGDPPGVLIDFFPEDFITIIDESHVTVPQIRGMYNGDQARKQVLVDHGFRLPSAKDNRPLTFEEFDDRTPLKIHVSATPGPYELEKCEKHPVPSPLKSKWDRYNLVEQIIRPTGLLDPTIETRKTKGQIDHLLGEINKRIQKNERVLVTTLTIKMSEDICQYLQDQGLKVGYLHSKIKALDRIDVLHNLRTGTYDVLVGVNLLREGLDLPEVSLVAILDADKEGFLRNERSLIQTIGRAARNVNGTVILYADSLTDSMKSAIEETNRRREIQDAHNKAHNIVPQTIIKEIKDIRSEERQTLSENESHIKSVTPSKLPQLIKKLENDMKKAAENLEFEVAAVIRDQIQTLKESMNPVN